MVPDIFVNVPKTILYWVFVILSALLPLIFFQTISVLCIAHWRHNVWEKLTIFTVSKNVAQELSLLLRILIIYHCRIQWNFCLPTSRFV